MKKKLLISLSSFGLVAGFWACGDGSVEPLNEETDGYVKAMLETQSIDFASQVADAKKNCAADVTCENEMAKAQGSAILIESSAAPTPESSDGIPQPASSSSSRDFFNNFSSRGPIGQQSSSSVAPVVVESSSSEVKVPAGQYGTCAPSKATAELNEEVTWTFTFNTQGSGLQPTDIMNASFAWAMPDGTPESATGQKSAKTKYAVSGPKTTTVSVTAGGATQEVSCSPLNVNGAPITGCKCMPTNIQPDVSQGESATWTASGCTTTANIIGYTWKGATADASGLVATAPVTAKGDVVTGVSFTVENDDNTKETVACEDAKAIDITSPDYLLEVTGGQISQDKIEVLNEGCITVKGTWDNQYYTPTITVVCDASGSNVSLKITYGSATPVTGTGAYGVNNITMPLGKAQAGAIEYNNVCITLSGAESAKCGLGTQG